MKSIAKNRKSSKLKEKNVKDNKKGALDFSELERLLESVIKGYSSGSKYVYHYTTLDALLNGIISNSKDEKLTFWATNSNLMNDPEELKMDLKYFVEDVKQIDFLSSALRENHVEKMQETEDIYLLSFFPIY